MYKNSKRFRKLNYLKKVLGSRKDLEYLYNTQRYDQRRAYSYFSNVRNKPNIKYFVPLGLESTLKKWGAQNVVELDWWQPFER